MGRHGFATDQANDGVECIQVIEASAIKPDMSNRRESSDKDILAVLEAAMSPVEFSAPTFYDCILLDSEMPNLNGPKAARYLRDQGYKIPIIGLTGNVLTDDVNDFLDHGADHVMFKPFNFESFKMMITRSEEEIST